ncbi:hypothetical protein XBKB1_240005 [Xenorhabdus bovienii str. kraussei Becker Underwood]|uniref:Uncharacterized protein n=1 Tax=Xenorhabdus bovienii str. kraussei Becker Underwood TaxID=1398204 RepID=A0A077PIG9_XENBV|nr:hypothetical protein XBKB1_240005 [Xenorhabdus bovienii str. kraussei Becker Underwood]
MVNIFMMLKIKGKFILFNILFILTITSLVFLKITIFKVIKILLMRCFSPTSWWLFKPLKTLYILIVYINYLR